ncbi:MAG: hypothetical protein RBU30_23090, partial [Polyangia bacterium]|nr:hypothetical protein [Polyangia bacterium]
APAWLAIAMVAAASFGIGAVPAQATPKLSLEGGANDAIESGEKLSTECGVLSACNRGRRQRPLGRCVQKRRRQTAEGRL